MRRFPHSWQTLRTKLGFTKKRNRKQADNRHRRSRIEPLEVRALLSGDPLLDPTDEAEQVAEPFVTTVVVRAEPTFVLTNQTPTDPVTPTDPEASAELPPGDELPEYFVVSTTQTKQGPQATISINPAYADRPPIGLQTLKLELQLGGQVMQEYEVLIDIAEESFRAEFLADRVRSVEEKMDARGEVDIAALSDRFYESPREAAIEERRDFAIPLTPEQTTSLPADGESPRIRFADKLAETSEAELQVLASRKIGREDLLAEADSRKELYAEISDRVQQVSFDRGQATTDAEREAIADRQQRLKEMALLLASDLAVDMKSEEADVALAARTLRDDLVAVSDSYHTLFTGLEVDHEFQRSVNDRGDLKALAMVETGTYQFTPQVTIELGEHQAMVQVTQISQLRMAAAMVSVSGTSVVEDGSIDESNSTTTDGGASSLYVNGTSGANKETLLRFNVDEMGSLDAPTPLSSAKLKLSEIIDPVNSAGSVDVYVWDHVMPGGSGSPSDWDETNLNWNHIYNTLDLDSEIATEFTQLGTWTTGTTFDMDVTTQLERALLYGDANANGEFDPTGPAGDIEAFHLAKVDWDAYENLYSNVVGDTNDLKPRNDVDGDGVVDYDDVAPFFKRFGYSQADFNLDGIVDGIDFSVWQANFGTGTNFAQGDADIDGDVDGSDYLFWLGNVGNTPQQPETPELMVWLRPEDTLTNVEFAASEHGTVDGPTLEVTPADDLILNDFTVEGDELRVDYTVWGDSFTSVGVDIYRSSDSINPIYTKSGLESTNGAGHFTFDIDNDTTLDFSSGNPFAAGEYLYAKISGDATEAISGNNEIDFEFSTSAHQVVNSLDDAGMDTLRRDKHTLRELLEADRAVGWIETITFDPALFAEGPQQIALGDINENGTADSLLIKDDVSIAGPGAHLLAISGSNQTRVIGAGYDNDIQLSDFAIENGNTPLYGGGISTVARLTLDGMVLRNNASGKYGGGIYMVGGDLTINNTTIVGNTAEYGGGMYSNPNPAATPPIDGVYKTRIENSTFTDNHSPSLTNVHAGRGAGLDVYGSSTHTHDVDILNSTFSGNQATKGAGIAITDSADVDIVNSTITKNNAYVYGARALHTNTGGGGVWLLNANDVTLHNSIIGGNMSSATWRTNISLSGGSFTSASSHNLVEYNTNGTSTGGIPQSGMNNIILNSGTDLSLAPLGDYGGPTPTHGPTARQPGD